MNMLPWSSDSADSGNPLLMWRPSQFCDTTRFICNATVHFPTSSTIWYASHHQQIMQLKKINKSGTVKNTAAFLQLSSCTAIWHTSGSKMVVSACKRITLVTIQMKPWLWNINWLTYQVNVVTFIKPYFDALKEIEIVDTIKTYKHT